MTWVIEKEEYFEAFYAYLGLNETLALYQANYKLNSYCIALKNEFISNSFINTENSFVEFFITGNSNKGILKSFVKELNNFGYQLNRKIN